MRLVVGELVKGRDPSSAYDRRVQRVFGQLNPIDPLSAVDGHCGHRRTEAEQLEGGVFRHPERLTHDQAGGYVIR